MNTGERLARVRNAYRFTAVTLLKTVIAFTLLNLPLAVAIPLLEPPPGPLAYGDKLNIPYPGLSKEERTLLLQELWTKPKIYMPYVGFGEAPLESKYVNVTREGFRKIKNQCSWPPEKKRTNIFVFGGSTTFGQGVMDHQTVPSFLQEELRSMTRDDNICVYNFGRGGYFSTQEKILFVQLITDGNVPDAALFIDGWNDFHFTNNEPDWTEQLRLYAARGGDRLGLLRHLPILQAARILKARAESLRKVATDSEEGRKEEIEESARILQANHDVVKRIGTALGTRVYSVIQPIPSYKYNISVHFLYEGDDSFIKNRRAKIGYELLAQKYPRDSTAIWLADLQRAKNENLYVDQVHYTDHFSHEIAREIAARMLTEEEKATWYTRRTM